MKVAHVGNVQMARANGVHAATRRLAECQASDGLDVEIWHFSRAARTITERMDRGLTVFDLPVRGLPGSLGSHMQIPTRATASWLQTRAGDVDVFHLHSVFQSDHRWVKGLGRPYVVTPHGGYDPVTLTGTKGLTKRLIVAAQEARMLRGAVSVQALTDAEQGHVDTLVPGTRTIRLPFPLDSIPDTNEPYADRGPVTFIGRLDVHVKGLDLLLDAAAQCQSVISDYGLLLIGPDERGSAAWIAGRVRALGLEQVVTIEPAISDRLKLAHRLRSASVFVHTSRREGLPTAVLEAMQCAVPVLVTHATNLGGLVGGSDAGVVVSSRAASISWGLVQLLAREPQEREAMGRRGRAAVSAEFSWANLRHRYTSLYDPSDDT